jgi:hypothetical protein
MRGITIFIVYCDDLIPRPRSRMDCVKDRETEKASEAQQRAVET